MDAAKKMLQGVRGKPASLDERAQRAIELAGHILVESERRHTGGEKRKQSELARMMSDPVGKAFTTAMTDQCFRPKKSKRIADQMVYLLSQFGIPRFLGLSKRMPLAIFRSLGRSLHWLMVPFAKMFLRKDTNEVIIPGEPGPLKKHILKRRKENIRLNLNHLGEAILGEEEAKSRLQVYLNDLDTPEIDYVSVKISTIYSQINLLGWEDSKLEIKERLRQLYRKAKDGGNKFVNLDMEEYRDLILTKEVFMETLDEEEFQGLSAGIVLQAYVPDSYQIQVELTEWAMERVKAGSAPIKIRIVKGANMAMEQCESSLHDWPQAPYMTKIETDANYKRMLIYGCQREHAQAVHLGIASHNIFDIAFALLLRAESGIEECVIFEMLEGMANHLRRVVHELAGDVLLYCAVATKKDFQSAIAYLIRRLDENTGVDNFLSHSFGMTIGSKAWEGQKRIFLDACSMIETVSDQPRRFQDRNGEPEHLPYDAPFVNESDTDFSLPQNRRWAEEIIKTWQEKFELPVMEGGAGEGSDPSRPKRVLYRYPLMEWEHVSSEVEACCGMDEPDLVLANVAKKLREMRGDLIGAMVADGGKMITEADVEISEAIDFAEYYRRSIHLIKNESDVKWTPKGRILVTPPWNFPLAIPVGGIIAGLATGNGVLFKPARETLYVGWMIANLMWDAGVPRESLKFIACEDDPVGSQLIKDPRIASVILTGATDTARLFMRIRPDLDLSAETGGKNAMIITALSDRDLAIKELVHSAFGHAGQKCSAASLAILEKEVYDDPNFMRQLADAVESLHVGSAWDLSSKMPPMIHAPEGKLLKGLTTLEPGESWLVKPVQDPNNPNLWTPGVKLGVREGSYTHLTEFFGPVLALMRAKSVHEAIRIANGSAYGLTSGLQSLDTREQKLWMKHIEAGNCYINRGTTGAVVQRQPFGGCKASSFGHGSKAGGPNYLTQFMHPTQTALPQEKHRINDKVNALTPIVESFSFSPDELGTYYASTANYAHAWQEFKEMRDLSLIQGQDNYLKYLPRHHMTLRINATDNKLDILRTLAAALTVSCKLRISMDPIKELPIHSLFQVTEESEEEFIKNLPIDRVRLLTPPSDSIRQKASELGTFLDHTPVLANGRFELLHFLREMALSIDYHRYGNLGTRETERRKPIL